jgi:hypothetical protein
MTHVRGKLELHGKTATGVEIPEDAVTALGGGRRPPVRATINGYEYRTSIGSMGGRAMLPVSAEVRAASGVSAGEEIEIGLELDDAPREVEVPDDLAAALGDVPAAQAAFVALNYSNKRRLVLAIEAAKAADTRQRRVAKTVTDLAG